MTCSLSSPTPAEQTMPRTDHGPPCDSIAGRKMKVHEHDLTMLNSVAQGKQTNRRNASRRQRKDTH